MKTEHVLIIAAVVGVFVLIKRPPSTPPRGVATGTLYIPPQPQSTAAQAISTIGTVANSWLQSIFGTQQQQSTATQMDYGY